MPGHSGGSLMATAVRSAMLGAGIGAGLMFLLDPARGARRRALVRDKLVRATHKSGDAYDATSRDLGNRLRGAAAGVRARARQDGADDRTVEERVRAALGRISSHPRAIHVSAVNGSITLSGDVLASERSAINGAVRSVRGVEEVNDRLTAHAKGDGTPALQGASSRPGRRSSWIAGSWSPAAKVIAGVGAAASVAAVAASRRS